MDLAITFIIMGALVIVAWICTDIYLNRQKRKMNVRY